MSDRAFAGALEFDRKAASESIKNNRDTHILLTFGEGDESIRFWSTDLTAEYVPPERGLSYVIQYPSPAA